MRLALGVDVVGELLGLVDGFAVVGVALRLPLGDDVVGKLLELAVGVAVGQAATAHQGPVPPVGLTLLGHPESSNRKPVG
jgi:hypothetical protein